MSLGHGTSIVRSGLVAHYDAASVKSYPGPVGESLGPNVVTYSGISVVESHSATMTAATDTTVTFSTTLEEGDVVVVFRGWGSFDGLPITNPAGYTQFYFATPTPRFQGDYKRMGPTPDTFVDVAAASASATSVGIVYVLRGVDPDTFLDTTPTLFNGFISADQTPSPSITPVTDDALIIAFGGFSVSPATTTNFPTGYTNTEEATIAGGTTLSGAVKLLSGGKDVVETPSGFSWAGLTNAVAAVTIAVRPYRPLDAVDGAVLNVLRDGVSNDTIALGPVEAGKKYQLQVVISAYRGTTSASFRIAGNGSNVTPAIGIGAAGTFSYDFIADVTGTLSINGDNTGTDLDVDFVTVKEIIIPNYWYDLSGNGNTGTLVNVPTYSSAENGGIVLDGYNDYCTIPDSPSIDITGTSITLEVVSKNNNLASAAHGDGLICKGSGTNDGAYEILLIPVGSQNKVFFRCNTMGNYTPGTILMDLNVPYCITCVLDNRYMRIYINGVEDGAGILQANALVSSTRALVFGTRELHTGSTSVSATNGTIYSAKVYNRALTATEVLQNFEAIRGRYGI